MVAIRKQFAVFLKKNKMYNNRNILLLFDNWKCHFGLFLNVYLGKECRFLSLKILLTEIVMKVILFTATFLSSMYILAKRFPKFYSKFPFFDSALNNSDY